MTCLSAGWRACQSPLAVRPPSRCWETAGLVSTPGSCSARPPCAGRRGGNLSEGSRAAINAFLYRTGEQSRDFCVVLATNRPSDLDPAVIDRTDDAIEFGLPGPQER